MLKDDNGSWVTSKKGLKGLARSYFLNLFEGSVNIDIPTSWPKMFSNLDSGYLASLNAPITMNHIKKVCFLLATLKLLNTMASLLCFFRNVCLFARMMFSKWFRTVFPLVPF